MKKLTLIVTITAILSACIEKYSPIIDRYERLLVVDGTLTNLSDSLIVKLSKSSSFQEPDIEPYRGCQVYIIDENYLIVDLVEIDDGKYMYLDSSFHAEIGISYQLHILTPDGKSYESNWSKMPKPSPIDSVYAAKEIKYYDQGTQKLYGYQFYLNNHCVDNEVKYYLWRFSETYEYKATFRIHFTWDNELIPFHYTDSLRRCWKTSKVTEFFTYSTKYIVPPILQDLPINFTSTQTKKLSIRYSLLVRQLSIDEQAFNFWDALKQQNISGEDLYMHQPFQITGNIYNVNNTDEPVLGYFTVASVTEKRIFVNKPIGIPFFYNVCYPDFDMMEYLYNVRPEYRPIYITYIPDEGLAGAAHESCFDCRLEGGKLIPPDFWIKSGN